MLSEKERNRQWKPPITIGQGRLIFIRETLQEEREFANETEVAYALRKHFDIVLQGRKLCPRSSNIYWERMRLCVQLLLPSGSTRDACAASE
jgi:hypothetical protein